VDKSFVVSLFILIVTRPVSPKTSVTKELNLTEAGYFLILAVATYPLMGKGSPSKESIKKDTEKSVPFSIVIPVISWVAMSYQLVNPTLLALIAELVKMTSVDNFCKNSTL
jgi:hypothetical protein